MASPSDICRYRQSIELARAADHMKELSRQIIENIVLGNTDMLRGHLSDMEAILQKELSRVGDMKEDTYVSPDPFASREQFN